MTNAQPTKYQIAKAFLDGAVASQGWYRTDDFPFQVLERLDTTAGADYYRIGYGHDPRTMKYTTIRVAVDGSWRDSCTLLPINSRFETFE